MRLATDDADRSVMPARRRSTAASVLQLLDDAVQSVSIVDVSSETISLWIGLVSAADFVHVSYIEDKQI